VVPPEHLIPLARPAVGDAEAAALARVLASGRYVAGAENAQLETALAARCGRRHALTTSSGTAALELVLWALGIGAGDEVLVAAFGFPAAANAISAAGAIPIAVDVERTTWNIDLADARRRAGARARALVSIDQFGLVTETEPLRRVATELGLDIIGDSACAVGARDSGGIAGGGYGRAAILSFHPRKVMTTGEGGAILSDDDALVGVLRELRNHGQSAPGQFVRCGTNARLSEFHAALGRVQLERLEAMLAERRRLAAGYLERLHRLCERERIEVQRVPRGAEHSYQTFAVLLAAGVARDQVRASLGAAGIESGPGTYAFHRLPPFAAPARSLPIADALHERSLALPLYIGMRAPELDRVAEALEEALA
jgi:dTDP-4-amino-4,6-dideoxygalactose transaminase